MRKDRRTRKTIDGKSAPYRIKWTNPAPFMQDGEKIYPLIVVAVLNAHTGNLELRYAGGQIGLSKNGLVIPGYQYVAADYRTVVYHLGCRYGEHEASAKQLLVILNEQLSKGHFWMPHPNKPLPPQVVSA